MSELDKFQKPSVTSDIIVFSIIDGELNVLLVKRNAPPFKDIWCLPGGFVKMDEGLEKAALRVLEEKTGVKDVYLEQLYTFGEPKRDPRGRVISVAYYVLLDATKIKTIKPKLDMNISEVLWFPEKELPKLGFDHEEIIKYAVQRLRYKLEYSSVGLELLPQYFTLGELQKLYEVILDEKLDKRNFRKKINSMKILESSRQYKEGQHRPAKLYKFRKKENNLKFKRVKFEG